MQALACSYGVNIPKVKPLMADGRSERNKQHHSPEPQGLGKVDYVLNFF